MVLLAGIGVGLYFYLRPAQQQQVVLPATFRTATIANGTVESSLRLTGVTAARNFVSLTTPQMRGSRSDRALSAVPAGSATQPGATIQSTQGGNTTPGASNGNGASLSAVTTRSGSTGSAAAGGNSSGAAGSSASMGASGLGSTSNANGLGGGGGSGGGGGGGGGMGGMFALVLQDLARPGSVIKKGAQVAEFDRQFMIQRLDDYQAAVLQSELNLKSLKANLEVTLKAHDQTIETARAAMEKARLDLKTIPVLSAIDTEKLKLAFEAAQAQHKQLLNEVKLFETSQKADIRNAELDLEEARAELKRAQANADKMVIKAPIDGLIVMQQTFRGSDFTPIQAGDQLMPGQFFMSIVDPSSMVVNATVNQVDIERLRIGTRARVRFDAYPDLELPARIDTVGGLPKSGGMRDTFLKELPIRLVLERMDPRVIPDLSVSVDVILEQSEGVIAPAGAVFRDKQGGEPFLFVKSAEGWTRQPVQLGTTSFLNVAVKSGLKAGDVVALERPPEPGEK